jgi:hypothetical protein
MNNPQQMDALTLLHMQIFDLVVFIVAVSVSSFNPFILIPAMVYFYQKFYLSRTTLQKSPVSHSTPIPQLTLCYEMIMSVLMIPLPVCIFSLKTSYFPTLFLVAVCILG